TAAHKDRRVRRRAQVEPCTWLEVLHRLRSRTKRLVGPAHGALADSCRLDSLTSDMFRGAHLAQVRIAGRAADDQHGVESCRAEGSWANPAGEVSVESILQRREPAAALAELCHFAADLGAGIGALPQR